MNLLFLFLMLSSLFSQTADKSRFTADKYIRKPGKNLVILDGNVTVVKGLNILKADHIELNTSNEDFTATGSVIFKGDSFSLEGEKLEGNMSSPKGVLSNGKIISGKDIVSGKRIIRKSRKEFTLKQGRHTSCADTPPDWRFYGNSIDMKIGSYAHLNNVIVEVFGIPSLYIPYLLVPLKTERQSGLLHPSFGFGSDGFNIDESLFVVINRSHDATFTLGHYSKRGLKQGIELRSAFAENSYSELYFFHITDKKFKETNALDSRNRQSLRLDQDFRIEEKTNIRTRIRYVSDDDLPSDFPEEIEGRADPALENRFVINKSTSNISYTSEFAYYQDLLSSTPTESNSMQLHKLPELRVNMAKTRIGDLLVEGDVSFLNIYRSGLPYDDINNNNEYDNGEFIRTGQRFDIFPRISMPIPTRYIKITPQAGLRYDYYNLPVGGNASRAYAEVKTTLNTEISKVYKRGEDKNYRIIKHRIEPFIEHRVVPKPFQTEHPFFTNTFDDIESPMFDSIDRTKTTHIITYGIDNILLAKYVPGSKESKKKAEDDTIEKNGCKDCSGEENNTENSDEILYSSSDEFLGLRKAQDKKQKKDKDSSETQKNTEINNEEENFSILQPFRWSVYQSYNFIDETGEPFGYLFSDMWANYEWVSLYLSNFYNVYTKKMGVNSDIYIRGRSKYLRFGYSYDRTNDDRRTNQIRMDFGFDIWRFGTSTKIIINNELKGTFAQKIQDKVINITYRPSSSCWYLQVKASDPYDREGFQFTFTFNLLISGQSLGFGKDSAIFNR